MNGCSQSVRGDFNNAHKLNSKDNVNFIIKYNSII